VEFEWDATKAEINERKHGISFEVAAAVFSTSSAMKSSMSAAWTKSVGLPLELWAGKK
jgi:uncharacterized DUF497 family protein